MVESLQKNILEPASEKILSKKFLEKRSKIVGILNLTPDSFSDGGLFVGQEAALRHLDSMLDEGADVIDVGAESTRPGAKILDADQEWQRLGSILPQIIAQISNFNRKNKASIQVSLDSYHFENMVKAYEMGVFIINDVSGLTDPRVIEFIAKNNITAILMHNLAIHANPALIINQNLNVNREIIDWAKKKIEFLEKFGVKKSQLIFDPGIGFSKNAAQSIQILKNIESYRILGLPLYVGHSKKSCLDELKIDDQFDETWGIKNFSDFLGSEEKQFFEKMNQSDLKTIRAYKTLIVSKFLMAKKVEFLRVHDVKAHCQILESLS